MPKKRPDPNADPFMVAMLKAADGDHVTIGSTEFTLPNDDKLHKEALQICQEYDSAESMAAQILSRCSLELELLNEEGVFENRIGLVLKAFQEDAEMLANSPDIYGDIVGAVGEACTSIEDDRIEVVK